MATYIKSLKEDNGDIILPQTSADAVLASDDTTVQSKLDNYATVNKTTSSATTATNCVLKDASGNELHPTTDFTQVNGTVPTAKIASSAVTSAKLASSAVTTAKIADSAVTSAKIDWTTLGVKGGELTEDVAISGLGTVLSCTLPAGKWLIFAGARFYGNSSTNLIMWFRLAIGSNSSAAFTAVNTFPLDNMIRVQTNFAHLETLTSSTTIGLTVESGISGFISKNKTYLYALRVG